MTTRHARPARRSAISATPIVYIDDMQKVLDHYEPG